MIVEHTFVTTLDEARAFQVAADFLAQRGFIPSPQREDAAPANRSSLTMSRGKKSEGRARSVAELPQALHLEYDRGRVTVAIRITPSAGWGGRPLVGAQAEVTEKDITNPARLKLHYDLVTAIATGLEKLLASQVSAQEAARCWEQAEARIAEAAQRRKKQNAITLLILVLVFAGALTMIFSSISYSQP
ncbi:MAG TPA: hypothetical protein VEH27_10720 [Methylomirabilota bacterium]|nr:hypothetical protein [Methylomirabilota bacterium]